MRVAGVAIAPEPTVSGDPLRQTRDVTCDVVVFLPEASKNPYRKISGVSLFRLPIALGLMRTGPTR